MDAVVDAPGLVAALGGRWSGRRGTCRCPAHADRMPSLSVAQANDGRLLLYCFGGCPFPAILVALRRLGLLPERGARWSWAPPTPRQLVRRERLREQEEFRRVGRARRIWTGAAQDRLQGLVRTYWRSRGITLDPPPTIRSGYVWHDIERRLLPAQVAAIQGASGRLQGVHLTFLRPDGRGKAPIERPRLVYGVARGGAVRLAPAGGRLGLTEGLENGLTAVQVNRLPTWAALSATNLSRLALPPRVEELVVFGDGDPVGEREARRAVEVYAQSGLRVELALAPPGQDLNDLLLAATVGRAA